MKIVNEPQIEKVSFICNFSKHTYAKTYVLFFK